MKTRLKELRARDGLNQTELAKRTKVSRQTISLIEREELMPSLLIAMKLSRIFNEPIDQIFIFKEHSCYEEI
ncbi:helix-turn-helix transcriptional regulator [Gracilibacillus thailandensis]|uniref:Helix-turn-helix domain-containing protein n=1 Tax=Gracilibacillus thailandensis TaxID=563735 RepID=A0A6N7R2R4_9BACI|nr:helix-turn-helix transcriptional regulator [Gracilibacillus thailandensis]MRI67379.1 helix-turn-helix domain-containing protein [Gracilibacillus thailandensis]